MTTGINVRYRRTEIGHVLERAAPRLLLGVRRWHDADFQGMVAWPDCVWLDGEELRAGTAPLVERLAGDTPSAQPVAVDPDDPAAIVFTSGTTGRPKGAWYAHRSILALADIEARRHPARAGAPPVHLAAGTSFAHVGTMARIAIQIGSRACSLIHDTFDTATVLATIARERLTNIGAFPTQAVMLLDHPDRPRHDLGSLRSVLLGGAPASPELIRRVQRELGVVVSVRYSSTEVGIATASLSDDPVDVLSTTVGKPTPGVDLRITGDDGVTLAAGEVGGVEVRSAATMRGYWHDPDATAGVVLPDGFIRTGDLGFLDDAGYLHLRGRRSEMFIRGGFNVHPSEIEDLLATPPQGIARRCDRRTGRHVRRGGLGVRRAARRGRPADARRAPHLRRRRDGQLQASRRPHPPAGDAADTELQGRQAGAAHRAALRPYHRGDIVGRSDRTSKTGKTPPMLRDHRTHRLVRAPRTGRAGRRPRPTVIRS